MDLTTLLLALPIFLLAYQGVGLLLDARTKQPGTSSTPLAESKKALSDVTRFGGRLAFNQALLRNKKLNERLDLLLLRSAYPFGWKAEDLLFYKELTGLFCVLLLWQMKMDVMTWPPGLILGFWLPDVYLKAKGTARQASIQRLLPGFVDLMALALESGLDFMAAVERILEKMKPSSLRDELQSLLQESRLGTPRKEALEHLAFRVNLPDVQSLTSIIIQSEELGTSLASVLRTYTEDMRNRRILRAEEIAGKAPVKLLFPMMVFFFPIVFVIIFGPLAMNFMASSK